MIPARIMNGLDLLYYSDLSVGAGGTMNREAALLGTPVYTLFAGKKAAVDQHLIEDGKMFELVESNDLKLERLQLKKKVLQNCGINSNLLNELVEEILKG